MIFVVLAIGSVHCACAGRQACAGYTQWGLVSCRSPFMQLLQHDNNANVHSLTTFNTNGVNKSKLELTQNLPSSMNTRSPNYKQIELTATLTLRIYAQHVTHTMTSRINE